MFFLKGLVFVWTVRLKLLHPYTQVNSMFESVEEYGGCDAVRYKNVTDLVYMDLIVKILYVIDLRIPAEVSFVIFIQY